VTQQLRTLAPRHHHAIRLKLDGASGREIAETLGVETSTVYLWMGDPLVKDELARQLERISDETTSPAPVRRCSDVSRTSSAT
jgi:hypothetical protein